MGQNSSTIISIDLDSETVKKTEHFSPTTKTSIITIIIIIIIIIKIRNNYWYTKRFNVMENEKPYF